MRKSAIQTDLNAPATVHRCIFRVVWSDRNKFGHQEVEHISGWYFEGTDIHTQAVEHVNEYLSVCSDNFTVIDIQSFVEREK